MNNYENGFLCVCFSDRVQMSVWMIKVQKSYGFKYIHICKAFSLMCNSQFWDNPGWVIYLQVSGGE